MQSLFRAAGLAAILWQDDDFGHVRPGTMVEDGSDPILRETARQFAGRALAA